MNNSLSILFAEDYFVCSILPNEGAWETIKIDGAEHLLLYFYVSDGKVRNDSFAMERFEHGDAAAFGGFYEAILDEKQTFRRFDLDLKPIQLLHDVVQQVKSAYLVRMRAFDSEPESAAEIRVNLCFVPGIEREARRRIRDFLVAEGFQVACEVDYLEAFLKSLQRKAIVHSRVNLALIESSFGDLRFHYVEYDDRFLRRESELITGRGVDYRVGNLARLFVEKAARQTSSRILNDPTLMEQETKALHRLARLEIDKFEFDELDLRVKLSDHSSARVIVDRRELDRMSSESFQFIKFRFESFISKHSNLARTEKILLNGNLLSSGEFVQFFERTFGASKVVRPFDNFVELLSRGIFAMAPLEHVEAEKKVEITITLTTTKGNTPSVMISRPAPPPVPTRPRSQPANPVGTKAPPLPPRRPTNPVGANSDGTAVKPPIPPARPPVPDRPRIPPLPPIRKRKDTDG